MTAAETRCPACGAMVVDVHECSERWEEPELGTKGIETTRCEVVDGRMTVSISGSTDMSGVPVMSLGDETVNEWFDRGGER